jgi:hypothetical protein
VLRADLNLKLAFALSETKRNLIESLEACPLLRCSYFELYSACHILGITAFSPTLNRLSFSPITTPNLLLTGSMCSSYAVRKCIDVPPPGDTVTRTWVYSPPVSAPYFSKTAMSFMGGFGGFGETDRASLMAGRCCSP